MKINTKYIIAFLILLIIEIIIGIFIKDAVIRPYLGDVLVVILIYALIRGLTVRTIKFLPAYVFLLALIVELTQYYRIVEKLNLQNYRVISTIIGTSFDVKDIFCYFIGCIILIAWEKKVN